MRKLLFILVAVAAGWAGATRSAPPSTPPGPPPIEAWSRVLERFVDDQGRVDFAALARDRADLDRFVAYVGEIAPGNAPELFPSAPHVLAFHINAYNALAMHKVIERGIPTTLAGFAKIGFFYFGKVTVGGEAISLYDYENRVIRTLGEPRIHFALNCMSVGCPRLPREPFEAVRLDGQLDRETRRFLGELRNVAVDDAARVVRLSEMFDFYTADFLAVAPSLTAYVNRFRTPVLPLDYAIEFMDYDWTINRQP